MRHSGHSHNTESNLDFGARRIALIEDIPIRSPYSLKISAQHRYLPVALQRYGVSAARELGDAAVRRSVFEYVQ